MLELQQVIQRRRAQPTVDFGADNRKGCVRAPVILGVYFMRGPIIRISIEDLERKMQELSFKNICKCFTFSQMN